MRIEQLTVDHISEIVELAKLAIEETNYYGLEIEEDYISDYLRELILDTDFHMEVLLNDNKLIGFFIGYLSSYAFNSKKLGLDGICYIIPKYRTLHNVSTFYKNFEKFCVSKGVKEVRVHINSLKSDTKDKKNLFLRLGYSYTGGNFRRDIQ